MSAIDSSATNKPYRSDLAYQISGDLDTSQKIAKWMANGSYFYFLKGEGAEKKSLDTHSLLTLNLCMMNGSIPALYGGVTASVAKRAEKAAAFIASYNPDIFLAQEVTLESSKSLFDAMKKEYPYFWTGIGIEPGKKEANLFVASKYSITSEPIFIPFPPEMQAEYEYPGNLNELYGKRLIWRGFFAIETPTHWIVTTHLEPGNKEKGLPYRRKQLVYLTEQMDKVAGKKPYILSGDMNVARTTDEANEYYLSGIPDLYYDYYTEKHPEFDDFTFTCTNLFTARTNKQPEPTTESDRHEIDDYVLIRKHQKDRFKNLQVELLRGTYDVSKDPSEAITDHRAYLARYELLKI